jgi:hypothetical protein
LGCNDYHSHQINYREADVLEKLDLFYAPKNEEHISSPCDILFLLSL